MGEITNLSESWSNDHSGKEVEEFIKGQLNSVYSEIQTGDESLQSQVDSLNSTKQGNLTAGKGIIIGDDNTISTEADPTIGKVVEDHTEVSDPVEGLLYLEQTSTAGTYEQWIWNGSSWVDLGAYNIAVVVDDEIDSTSTNPVQNKVIKGALDELSQNVADVNKVWSNDSSNNVDGRYLTTNGNYTTATGWSITTMISLTELTGCILHYFRVSKTANDMFNYALYKSIYSADYISGSGVITPSSDKLTWGTINVDELLESYPQAQYIRFTIPNSFPRQPFATLNINQVRDTISIANSASKTYGQAVSAIYNANTATGFKFNAKTHIVGEIKRINLYAYLFSGTSDNINVYLFKKNASNVYVFNRKIPTKITAGLNTIEISTEYGEWMVGYLQVSSTSQIEYLKVTGSTVYYLGQDLNLTNDNAVQAATFTQYQVEGTTDAAQGFAMEIEVITKGGYDARLDALEEKNSVSDLQTYINENRYCVIPAGTYTIDTPLTIPSSTHITGTKGAVKIVLGSANTAIEITPNSYDIQIDNITFIGKNPITTIASTIPSVSDMDTIDTTYSDVGILIDGTNGGGKFNVNITNCRFEDFGHAGIKAVKTRITYGGSVYAQTPIISGCRFYHNWYGILLAANSQFNLITGCVMQLNQVGVFEYGANSPMVNCEIMENYMCGLILAGGDGNSVHNIISNCYMVHNGTNVGYTASPTTYDIACVDIDVAVNINGCMIGINGIALENSRGMNFSGCQIIAPIYITNAVTTGWNSINGCTFRNHNKLGKSNVINGSTTYMKLTGNVWSNETDNTDINN